MNEEELMSASPVIALGTFIAVTTIIHVGRQLEFPVKCQTTLGFSLMKS